MTGDEQRFSDRDVERIIEKALEMQRRGRQGDANSSANRDNRLTLANIEQAAKEVGIGPSLIREAVYYGGSGTRRGARSPIGVGLGALGMPVVTAIIAVGTLGLTYLLSRFIFRAVHAKRKRETLKVASRIQVFLSAGPS